MSIKNLGTYYCSIENIEKRDLKQYMNYLLSEKHENHDDTEILGNSMNNEEIEQYLLRSDKYIDTNINNNTRGVKLKVSEKSLVLTIPPTYNATREQCLIIQEEMFRIINNMYRNEGSDRSEDIFSNIHYQDNPHINFTIPYLDENGKTLRFTKSKGKFFKQIAKHFTKVVDETLGTNIKDYKTQSELDLIAILSEFSTSLIEYLPEEQKEIVGHFKEMESEGNVEAIKRLVGDMKSKVAFSDLVRDYKKGITRETKDNKTDNTIK